MIFSSTRLTDAVIIDVERHGDERGYLARTYCEQEFADHGLETRFVQASTIFSPARDTLRGLHFQRPPHGEVKVVRCTRGAARVTMGAGPPTRGDDGGSARPAPSSAPKPPGGGSVQ